MRPRREQTTRCCACSLQGKVWKRATSGSLASLIARSLALDTAEEYDRSSHPCPCCPGSGSEVISADESRKEGRGDLASHSPGSQIPHPARSSRGSPCFFSPSFSHKDVKAASALALARRQALIINTRGGARQSGGRQASACFSSGRPAGKRDETASGGLPASRT